MSRAPDLGLLLHALALAAHKHRDQRRKGADASPYINHPIAVANVLVNEGGVRDTDVLCAALLHDTLEDTLTSAAELLTEFGPAITAIVREVSDDRTLPQEMRKRLQVEHAPSLSRAAKLVKLADKICNLRDIDVTPPRDWTLERKQRYFDWARAVVDGLRGINPALEAAFDEAYARRPA
jgi:guanosine-3',5'-bis(diphosphate) 3'-pyrophosphohydrolase